MTKQEIQELEREIAEQPKRRTRMAVNPKRQYAE